MNLFTRSAVAPVSLLALATLAGCQSPGAGARTTAGPSQENYITQTGITEADLARVKSTEPLGYGETTLFVNGLGCPLCASAIDLQLKRVKGIETATVDLSTGRVRLMLGGKDRPSPARLAQAVADAGFTLVKVESR